MVPIRVILHLHQTPATEEDEEKKNHVEVCIFGLLEVRRLMVWGPACPSHPLRFPNAPLGEQLWNAVGKHE